MTKSPNQKFVLEQFQGVLRELEQDEFAGVLGVLVDVREAGFVNKELDAHINRLREDSVASIPQLIDWLGLMVERLMAFQGDFGQLVGEFSEAEVGLSEAEWSSAESISMAVDSEEVDFFGEFDDFESLGDIESFGDFDGEEFDFDLPMVEDIVDYEDIDHDAIFSDIEELEVIDAPGEQALAVGDDGEGDAPVAGQDSGEESDPFWADFALEEEAEQSGDDAADRVDFALIESSVSIDPPSLDAVPADDAPEDPAETIFGDSNGSGFGARARTDGLDDTASYPSVEEDSGPRELFGTDDFDFLDEFNAPPKAPEPEAAPGSGDALEESTHREVGFGDSEVVLEPEYNDGFDFDLGEPEVGAGQVDTAEPEDDFDFDFGFENPEKRNEELNRSFDADRTAVFQASDDLDNALLTGKFKTVEPVEESEPEGWGQGFDFGFDDDDLSASDGGAAAEGHALGAKKSSAVTATDNARLTPSREPAPSREMEVTPPSMPAIPRFTEPTKSTVGHDANDERTSPGDNEADVEELRTRASLDDDEFFELAESLAGDSSAPEIPPRKTPKKNRYRGEPLMVEPSRERTPTPQANPIPSGVKDRFARRERQDTPNPFKNQEPTGIRRDYLGSSSSFVLEEISPSEVHEDRAAADALMDEARRLFENGEFESARDLLSALMARDDVHEDAHALLAAVDAKLEAVYEAQLGPLGQTPQLNIAMSELASMTLDHRFGFLLSQIDGMSTFEDILELSSMSRLETLDVLAQMLKREIIRAG